SGHRNAINPAVRRTSRPAWRRRVGLMRYHPTDGEDGQEQRQGDAADDYAHEDDHDRLDVARQLADLVLELLLGEGADLVHNEGELAGFFAAVDHLADGAGDERVIVHRLPELSP